MCGIVGILNLDGAPADRTVLAAMTATIAHRGPDGGAQYVDGALGLGHRRLAIIDLSERSNQPMTSADGRSCLVYNGEIYNFTALRAELEGLGHHFVSTGDTEVVLAALRQWKAAAIERFNGMFALAFWDADTGTLTLARDRYGIKPLYWTKRGNALLFASEVKAFLPHPAFRAEMDVEALAEYLTFQNFFSDRILFKGVHMLPAGTVAIVAAERSGEVVPRRYWDFQFQEPLTRLSEADYIDQFDMLFRQAVQRQMVSDVEVGSFLSGGMDTGSITALATRHAQGMRTFTIGFDLRSASGIELSFDERQAAEYMSYLFKTEHYEMVLKAGDMERVLPRLIWHLEEPRVGQSYPNFYAARLASAFNKVVLAGTGGDELFGGYPWRYYRAVVNSDFEDYVENYYRYWQRLIPDGLLGAVMAPSWPSVNRDFTRSLFRNVFGPETSRLSRPEDYVNYSLYFEAKTFLHGLLTVEDKLSMAHGVEIRVPFLDNDLVDFATRLPVGMKLGQLGQVVGFNENESGNKSERYFSRTQDGKLLLRKAMSRYVPESVTSANKQGFSGPDASWFKGESIDFVKETLIQGNAMIYDYLDRGSVQELILDHLHGRINRRLLIWSLLSLEFWCQIFLGGGHSAGAYHRPTTPNR
ncbi:asparagine synthase (glutamine-hydrolyzing) [Magnetospirillum moscoviense]|uniref:asparagine synthase (glutamine-hydrolyzing) n=1 Tax=Magnetospirillum moscoviense TaxID=1437059 RepID=A0A178MX40_9PROT|nr:asparagine synthase (glutamine-hydrolyzing) [Magnetospirillum moscoviense]OAN55093.1 asparagine synthetase B [Magnetospirillum moscoviense]